MELFLVTLAFEAVMRVVVLGVNGLLLVALALSFVAFGLQDHRASSLTLPLGIIFPTIWLLIGLLSTRSLDANLSTFALLGLGVLANALESWLQRRSSWRMVGELAAWVEEDPTLSDAEITGRLDARRDIPFQPHCVPEYLALAGYLRDEEGVLRRVKTPNPKVRYHGRTTLLGSQTRS